MAKILFDPLAEGEARIKLRARQHLVGMQFQCGHCTCRWEHEANDAFDSRPFMSGAKWAKLVSFCPKCKMPSDPVGVTF